MAKGRKGAAKRAATKRADLKADRKIARKAGKTAEVRQLSKEMRKQGDIMRKASGREKGQRTTYTGPAKQATLTAIEKETGDVLSKTGTKWQQVNKAWLNDIMEKDPKLSLSQARSKLKTIFKNNRERFLTEQQRRYDANIVAPVLDTELEELDLGNKGKGKTSVAKMTGGSEYLATDYDRPGLQDWSDLAPPDMPGLLGSAKAQQDLLGSGLAAYQPWAQPATPYQPPVGPTYATRASLLGGAVPSVADRTAADTGDTTREEWLKTLPTARKDWWPNGATNDQMATWMNANPGKTALEWTNQLPNLNLFGLNKPGAPNPQVAGFTPGRGDYGYNMPTAASQDITQNQFQDLFADVGQVGGSPLSASNTLTQDQRMALSNVPGVRAPLAAPAPTVASAQRFTNYVDPLLLQQTNPFMTNQGTQNAYLAGDYWQGILGPR